MKNKAGPVGALSAPTLKYLSEVSRVKAIILMLFLAFLCACIPLSSTNLRLPMSSSFLNDPGQQLHGVANHPSLIGYYITSISRVSGRLPPALGGKEHINASATLYKAVVTPGCVVNAYLDPELMGSKAFGVKEKEFSFVIDASFRKFCLFQKELYARGYINAEFNIHFRPEGILINEASSTFSLNRAVFEFHYPFHVSYDTGVAMNLLAAQVIRDMAHEYAHTLYANGRLSGISERFSDEVFANIVGYAISHACIKFSETLEFFEHEKESLGVRELVASGLPQQYRPQSTRSLSADDYAKAVYIADINVAILLDSRTISADYSIAEKLLCLSKLAATVPSDFARTVDVALGARNKTWPARCEPAKYFRPRYRHDNAER